MLVYLIILAAVLCGIGVAIHFSLDKKRKYTDLKGKHVVITGGSSGIGKAAAVEAARLGAHVTIIGRDVTRLSEAVKEIIAACTDKINQKIQHAALDVTSDYNVIEECFKSLEQNVGPIFMLVNCAGMCICGQFDKMEIEAIKQMVDLNYFGTAYPTRCVLPVMKERNEGLIVFVSSEAALIGIYGYSAYSAGKWAVRGLAESVNMELIGTGVRLMTAFPPDTDTPGLKNEELTKLTKYKVIKYQFPHHKICDSGIYGYSAYSAGKWAVRGLAESVNMELIGTGVRLMTAFPPDTDTPGLKNEELTKPEETKLISGAGGLHSADDVGKQMIHDALVGKTYSVYSISGTLLTTLFGGTIEDAKQIVIQIFSMGILRIIMVGILLSFHNIVRDGLKKKNSQKTK